MTKQEHEAFADAALIDTSTKEPIDRDGVLELLKSYRVKTAPVENSEIPIEDIIPSLRKAKVNVPEAFFKGLASKLGLSFLEYSKVKKIYQEEQKSKLITVLPLSCQLSNVTLVEVCWERFYPSMKA